MSRVTYMHLPGGGFLATSSHRPDEYLTWLKPGQGTCSLNVTLHRQADGWEPRAIGRMLDWHGFQVQAEDVLGVDEHHIDPRPCELIYSRDLSQGRCSCGHWRATVPAAVSPFTVQDFAFVAERHGLHIVAEREARTA